MRLALIFAAVLLISRMSEATRLRIVITSDNGSPLSIGVNNVNDPNQWAHSQRTPTCNVQENRIPNGFISVSPTIGYGPIEFILDPVPINPSFIVHAAVGYCPSDGIFTPVPPTTATINVFEDEIAIYSGTAVVKNMQAGEPQSYSWTRRLYWYRLDTWIDFDFLSNAPEDWQKVIIASYRSDLPSPLNPSIFQEATQPDAPAKFAISGYLITKTGPVADSDLFLRVIDPPDGADYVTFNNQAIPNDNLDGEKRGRLTNSQGVVAIDGAILTAKTDEAGRFVTHLAPTRRYAGDNYRVEGSVDSQFSCAANCALTGTITAWKRAYIERSHMFKRSAFLIGTQDSQKKIRVDNVSELCSNCNVLLIHSPKGVAGQGTTAFYSEDARIVHLRKDARGNAGTLTLDKVLENTFKPGPSTNVKLGDAIGVIDNVIYPNGDFYFSANEGFLNQVYPASFVEYLFTPSRISPVPLMPHVAVLAQGTTTDIERAIYIQELSERWFSNAFVSNHQHYIAADRYVSSAFGVTRTDDDLSQSYIFMNRIAGSFGMSNADWRLAGEIVVHELAHQWHTNEDLAASGGFLEHCNSINPTFFNDSQKTCTNFNDLASNNSGSCTGVCPEYSDGIVGFHYKPATRHSEYMWIRRRPEPIPRFKGVPNQ